MQHELLAGLSLPLKLATFSPISAFNFRATFKRTMSEAECIAWESLFSSGKKRKKKVKSSPSKVLTQRSKVASPKKKKKNAKYKEAMDKRKAKRKEKKKKNKKVKLSKVRLEKDFDEMECTVNLTSQNTKKEPKKKRKKQVAFDLPHEYIRVKRPHFSSSLPSPVNDSTAPVSTAPVSTAPVSTAKEDTKVIEPSQIEAQFNDSQSTSDDIHSQDLFITQKTFRLPLSEISSGETSDRANDSTRVMGIYFRETKEQSVLFKTQKNKKSELYKKNMKKSPSNPFLDEPIVVTSSPDGDKAKESAVTQLSHGQQKKCMKSVYTQTENFFTTEVTLYLNFCKKSHCQAQSEELKPLDLSLPDRARKDIKTKDQYEETSQKDISEVSARGSSQLSLCAQGKEERTPSLESESENKSADTTVSSEDAEGSSRTTRLDLMQVRAVQMRLNESFFFKTKGERPSPRPESPLMKLVQGREGKSRKSH